MHRRQVVKDEPTVQYKPGFGLGCLDIWTNAQSFVHSASCFAGAKDHIWKRYNPMEASTQQNLTITSLALLCSLGPCATVLKDPSHQPVIIEYKDSYSKVCGQVILVSDNNDTMKCPSHHIYMFFILHWPAFSNRRTFSLYIPYWDTYGEPSRNCMGNSNQWIVIVWTFYRMTYKVDNCCMSRLLETNWLQHSKQIPADF